MIQKFTREGAAHQMFHLAGFVSEWCGGGKLVDYLRTVDYLNVDGQTMQHWCQNVAEALKTLHGAGIVHRNINPGNIYLDSGGRAKLGSYMCQKAARAPGCLFSFGRSDVGSWQMAAPEVENEYGVTPASDIFALGCCIYYFCCGATPNVGLYGVDGVVRQISLHFGNRVRGAVRMCLQPHPEVRADAEEVWKYLSVHEAMAQKKNRALAKLRGKIRAKAGIDHGKGRTAFSNLISQTKTVENQFKLAALAALNDYD